MDFQQISTASKYAWEFLRSRFKLDLRVLVTFCLRVERQIEHTGKRGRVVKAPRSGRGSKERRFESCRLHERITAFFLTERITAFFLTAMSPGVVEQIMPDEDERLQGRLPT
jgi:hypothetical protein